MYLSLFKNTEEGYKGTRDIKLSPYKDLYGETRTNTQQLVDLNLGWNINHKFWVTNNFFFSVVTGNASFKKKTGSWIYEVI